MAGDPQGDLPALWKTDFTVDNLIDYARAACALSHYVRLLAQDGYGQLVIPSRGAMPFVKAAHMAWRLDARAQPTLEGKINALGELNGSPFFEEIVLPFSADPNEQTQTTAAIRTYWTQVLAAIVRRDGKDSRLVFYKQLVEKLAKQEWLGYMPRDLPKERFIFVDTVVSGRAVCEIFKAFEEEGLTQCHFLLIVDAQGKELKPQYRRLIDAMVMAQRCTLIQVNRLFTEDRGPAVSGIWSTVYPQVLEGMRQRFPWASHVYGAGSYYLRVSSSQVEPEEGRGDVEYNMPITRMYATLSVCYYMGVQALHDQERLPAELSRTLGCAVTETDPLVVKGRADIEERLRRMLQYELRHFVDTIEELKPLSPLDKRTTQILAEPRVLAEHPNATVDVSSSHLVRVTLPDAEIESFLREAEREIALGHDVLADDWFR
ncbi:hypothetical protein [Roseateles noduli]|uniref:hypothetical protein n=1 Tax=Roseateles noduli TaxID=2052484 RepID=UPI003D6510D3